MQEYICVHCGANNPSVYKQFSDEIIKLTKCDNCNNLVGEYVETEYSIIIIDMLLLRKEALRHVLLIQI
ncbi:protein ARV1 [Caerostris extrusa]|uniref:Protein ARV n=1 Tax=Caerostris extrusa TaxID=172846 RepID=A0AAV4P5W8_CAEEX|nr:protein ARV1 [Caerostris extrusa]